MRASAHRRSARRALLFAGLSLLPLCAAIEARPVLAQETAPIDADANYLTSEALRHRALEALFERIGDPRPVSKLEITPERITLHTQSPDAAYYTDAWTVDRFHIMFIDRDGISGPSAAQTLSPRPRAASFCSRISTSTPMSR
jgi:hypothetical protein